MRLPGDDLLGPVSGGLSWISGEGPHADIILSTRVRLARNLEQFPFRETIAPAQQAQVILNLTSTIQLAALSTAPVVNTTQGGIRLPPQQAPGTGTGPAAGNPFLPPGIDQRIIDGVGAGNVVMKPVARLDRRDQERDDAEAGALRPFGLARHLLRVRAVRREDQQENLGAADPGKARRLRRVALTEVARREPAQMPGPLDRIAGRLGNRPVSRAVADEDIVGQVIPPRFT